MAAGDLLSLSVRDATPIDPDGGGIGADGSGWTASIVIDGLATGGTVDPSKVVLTVQDPGYDATGAAVTRTRTIRGTVPIRRQYPNNTQRMISATGGQLTIMIGLDDLIYAGSTVTAVDIGSGFYPGAATGAPASVSNASTRAYTKPVAGFLNLPQERATGSGYDVELVAFHRDAMLGRQVACVQFQGRDAANHETAVQTAGSVSLSSILTRGHPPEVYKARIPLAALDQAASGQASACCTVNARVFPWIGDSTAVLDMAADGAAWPTSSPITPLLFCNDKGGSYGGAIAYVQAGATGGTVSTNGSVARAAPFPSLNAAWSAIRTFNNANRGHDDHSGATIYLMDGAGGAVTHAQGGNVANMAYGQCWTDVRVDPLATGVVKLASSGQQVPHLSRYRCPIVHDAGKVGFVIIHGGPANWQMLAFDGAALEADAPTVNFARSSHDLTYYRNVTIAGVATNFTPFSGSGTSRVQQVYIAGCRILSSSLNMTVSSAWLIVGNDFKRVTHLEATPASYPNNDLPETLIIANNGFLDKRVAAQIGNECDYPKGIALVQNVYENANTASVAPLLIATSATGKVVGNLIEHHNVILGGGASRLYAAAAADAVAPSGEIKRGTSRFNIWYKVETRQDPFTTNTTVTGRVGNWEYAGGVGNLGNVCLASVDGSIKYPDPNGVGWLGMWWEPGSNYNVSTGGPPVTFVDDQAGLSGTGLGLGNYHLTGTNNAAYARVPAGRAVLAFDLDGAPRLNDGQGAAGPYERSTAGAALAPAAGRSDIDSDDAALTVVPWIAAASGLCATGSGAAILTLGLAILPAAARSPVGSGTPALTIVLAVAGGASAVGSGATTLLPPGTLMPAAAAFMLSSGRAFLTLPAAAGGRGRVTIIPADERTMRIRPE